MTRQITYDPVYNAVEAGQFAPMIEVDRYGERTSAFDSIISASADHFWDPTDPAYLDFDSTFDLREDTLMPPDFTVELNCAVADRLDEGQKIALSNEVTHWSLSSILHGEQGAASLSANLVGLLRDPGAQEYAANQTREEARHVTAFSRYIEVRWGKPLPAGPTLGNLLGELVQTPEIYRKLIGMQLLVEGLAMGSFATIHSRTRDPLLCRLVQMVMADEAFHHRFGKIWAERTISHLSEEEHEKVESWAAEVFQKLLLNLVNAEQKQVIYAPFGLDWQWVRSAVLESFGDAERRAAMTEGTNIFRVLIKTLLKAGIISERTRSLYASWVDMDQLAGESDEVVGSATAEQGIDYLRDINRNRRKIGRGLRN